MKRDSVDGANRSEVDLVVRDLGRMAYAKALELQRRAQRELIESRPQGGGAMTVFLVEHVPGVITLSRRPTAREHLSADAAQIRAAGVEVAETDRGGDVTYHGPGQLVVYPILDLDVLGLRLHGYMRFLEQIVIDTLAHFGVAGRRDPGATGVWVERGDEATKRRSDGGGGSGGGKICAMGVRVSRWVSMHGLALNVTTNLEHFDLIVPCGLAGRMVTSLERELGDRCPSMEEVKGVLVERLQEEMARSGSEEVTE